MSQHHCHLPGCTATCQPRYLMCAHHWFQVPAELQTEVYAAFRRRGSEIDSSWAAWWRAQAKACVSVLRKLADKPDKIKGLYLPPAATADQDSFLKWVDRWEAKELGFAKSLEVTDATRVEAPKG